VHPVSMRGEADLLAVWRLRRLVRRGGFDLLHLHTSHAHTLGVAAAALAGRPRARTVVSRRVDFSIYRHSFLGLNGWKYTRGTDRVVCVSNRIREVLVQDGLPPASLRVAHSGIDLARLDDAPPGAARIRAEIGIPADAPVIGNVAALAGHKGQRTLVEAAPRVLEAVPEAWILIAGDGALREELERRAEELGVSARVRFLGFRADVPSLLGAFTVFCFPSLLEGLGTSVLDAMAARLPIVASRAGGIPEAVEDGVSGLLVEPGAPGPLADALVSLLRDPDARRRLGAAARARVEALFTVERTVEGTLAVYRELMGGAR